MNITGAIFDFDGTLFDSMHVWKGIRDRYFEYIGLKLTKEDEELFRGVYLRESLILAKEHFSLKESYDELFSKFFEYIEKRYLSEAKPKNDIIEFLERLKKKGVKMGIATATGETALIAVLKKYGMREYFSSIISIYTVDAPKTHSSRVYDAVLEELGTDKETTWVFEDALYAAKTVKNNGYKLVGIYDKSEPCTEELKALSDVYIVNFSELEV